MDQSQKEIITPVDVPEGGLEHTTGAVQSPEVEFNPEQKEVHAPETLVAETEKPSIEAILPVVPKRKTPSPPLPRDEVTKKVEKILADGLKDSYDKLSPIAQQEFKLKGEETASKIRELLRATKIKVKKIFRMILEWLMLLPNINRFFLEQEAKIKTDRIIELTKQQEDRIV